MKWRITKDYLHEQDSSETNHTNYGNYKGNSKMLIQFRLLDDDDNIYFQGITNDTDFAPLDDFGVAFGCTSLHYKLLDSNVWEVL